VEEAIRVNLGQLLGRHLALNSGYRISQASLLRELPGIPTSVYAQARGYSEVLMHQLHTGLHWNHPSGFHFEAYSRWIRQQNRADDSALQGDDFWQFDLSAGWRFWRRHADLAAGVLNLADQDYRLNPLALHRELPRERTFFVSMRLSF